MSRKKAAKKPERSYRLIRLSMTRTEDGKDEELAVNVYVDLRDIRRAALDTIALGDAEADAEIPVTLTIRRVKKDLLRALKEAMKK